MKHLTNAQVREALQGSIKKWEEIVAGTRMDAGASDCPLCHMFNTRIRSFCNGCPVSEHTGLPSCRGTPYVSYRLYGRTSDARKELNYLRKLDHKYFVKGVTV